MNQVQEMLRLKNPDKPIEAVERLSCLFNLMSQQPGFLRAEVFRNIESPDTLLVLHRWESLADWQRFQTSEAKVSFSASRPAALYDFVPCGLNWSVALGDELKGSRYLRREVLNPSAPHPAPRIGDHVKTSQTFTYADDELPEYTDRILRLTRQRDAERTSPNPDAAVDEIYESLLAKTLESVKDEAAAAAPA